MSKPNLDEIIELDDSKLKKLIEEAERMKLGKRQMTRKEYYEIAGGVGIKEEEAEKILQESKDDMFTTSSFNVNDETLINLLRKEGKGYRGIYTQNLVHNILSGYGIKMPNGFLERKFLTKKFIYFFEQVFVKEAPRSGSESKHYKLYRERRRG
ncbi:Uncharacterised protein [uncultured archaeon]|nr:Uncharacterised protein [uncultured archaeon]